MKSWERPVRVYEGFTLSDGRIEYRWLWMYWVKRERRFAATEADAIKWSVAS